MLLLICLSAPLCHFACLSVCCTQFVCIVCLSLCPIYLTFCFSNCMSFVMSVCHLSFFLSVCLFPCCMSVCLTVFFTARYSICFPFSPSVLLSTACLSVCLLIRLPVCIYRRVCKGIKQKLCSEM